MRNDELYHHKYIEKHRGESGEWVYVYSKESMNELSKIEKEINNTLTSIRGNNKTSVDTSKLSKQISDTRQRLSKISADKQKANNTKFNDVKLNSTSFEEGKSRSKKVSKMLDELESMNKRIIEMEKEQERKYFKHNDQSAELYHYGVKGMRWGHISRQYEAQGITKRQIKSDNKQAFSLGKKATVLGRAMRESEYQTAKASKRMQKALSKDANATKKSTQKKINDFKTKSATQKVITDQYKSASKAAESHCKSLMKKYGSENVNSIKYKKTKGSTQSIMNEKVNTGKGYAKAAAITLGSYALSAVSGSPVYMVATPMGKNGYGRNYYKKVSKAMKK